MGLCCAAAWSAGRGYTTASPSSMVPTALPSSSITNGGSHWSVTGLPSTPPFCAAAPSPDGNHMQLRARSERRRQPTCTLRKPREDDGRPPSFADMVAGVDVAVRRVLTQPPVEGAVKKQQREGQPYCSEVGVGPEAAEAIRGPAPAGSLWPPRRPRTCGAPLPARAPSTPSPQCPSPPAGTGTA